MDTKPTQPDFLALLVATGLVLTPVIITGFTCFYLTRTALAGNLATIGAAIGAAIILICLYFFRQFKVLRAIAINYPESRTKIVVAAVISTVGFYVWNHLMSKRI